MEGPGDQPVAALVGMQPVHRPHLLLVRRRRARRVEVQRAEPGRHVIHNRVDLMGTPGERPGQRAGQAEHPAGVGEPHRQHLSACLAQRAHRVRGRVRDPVSVKAGPQRVVDSEHHARHVRAQLQGARQLLCLNVGGLRAVRCEHVQVGIWQPARQQRRPAAPWRSAFHHRPDRIADAKRDRVT